MSRTSKRPWFLIGVLSVTSLSLNQLLTTIDHEASPPPPRTVAIAPGTTWKGKMPSGAGKIYRMSLRLGQLLHLVVIQNGADVALVPLLPHNEEKPYKIDSPNGAKESEQVFLVASTAGDHGIRIEDAGRGKYVGEFLVRVQELREATNRDRENAEAEEHFYMGKQLAMSSGIDDLRKAERRYSAALHLWDALGNAARQADALSGIGSVRSSLHDWTSAAKAYRNCARLRAISRDWEGQADALSFAGSAHEKLGQLIQAEALYQDVLRVRAMLHNEKLRTASLYNLARVQRLRGQAERAITIYSKVVVTCERNNEASLQTEALTGRALAYLDVGRADLAQDDFERALELLKIKPDLKLQAVTLTQAAMALRAKGSQNKAIEMLQQALVLRRRVGDLEGEATTVNALGVIYYQADRFDDALDAFQRAAQIYKAQNQLGRQISVLSNLGWIHAVQGRPEIALRIFNDALPLARAGGNKPAEAALLYGMAYAEQKRGSLITARARIEKAIDAMESLRSRAERHDFRSSYLALREDLYGFKIELLMDQNSVQPRSGYDREAFQTSERARARGLSEALAEEESSAGLPADPGLLYQHKQLQEDINRLDQLLRSTSIGPGKWENYAFQLRMKIDQNENLEAQLRARSGRMKLDVPPSLALWEIQKRVIDRDSVVLEYYLGRRRSFVWLVTYNSFHGYEIQCPSLRDLAKEVHSEMAERRLVARKNGLLEDWEKLSNCVLGPVSGSLAARRLLIVAHDELQKIPFAALIDPTQPKRSQTDGLPNVLSLRHEVVNVPSLSVLVALRRQRSNRMPAKFFLALVADPVYNMQDQRMKGRTVTAATTGEFQEDSDLSGLSRLRGSEREAKEILSLMSGRTVEVALGFEARRDWVMHGHLEDAEIVHFATHGILNQEFPGLSGLALSQLDEQGHRSDGLLRSHEIEDLRLKAHLVVLSACQTALGKDIRGEGLVGLTQSFLVGGASAVLVSLWKVDDRATAELMKRFYRALVTDGLSPAAALRRAQVEMISDRYWRDPFYWAGFVLQGDWDARLVTGPKQ